MARCLLLPILILSQCSIVRAVDVQPVRVDFDTHIIPLLTKHGCNSGACHGAAAGRGGLRMSLYGSNALFDYENLVLELKGRRVNLGRPAQSLIFRKPTELLSHGGGQRFESDSESGRLLKLWIEQGANRNSKAATLVKLEVTPQTQIAKLNQVVKLKATATFSNDDQQDVTRWTIFHPDDDVAIKMDGNKATILRRGRHVLSARYLDQLVPVEFLVPLNKSVQPSKLKEPANFIDRFVNRRLQTLKLPVSARADEATLLRRVYVDLIGRLPQPKVVVAFLSDQRANKVEKLIERLLASDEFVTYWTYRFSELLRIRTQPQDTTAARKYFAWLRGQIAKNVGLDKIATELITATGDTHVVGPANFYRTVGGAREQAEFASELFMGMTLRCANCHDHPLDKWTQDDYHGLAAIFAKVKTGRVIGVNPRAEVSHPRTGSAAIPRIPGDSFLATDQDGRPAFARWLTKKDNPYFAKAMVNRVWQASMGRGLVEPTDDLWPTNVATHPALLEALAQEFATDGFDLRKLLRLICNSHVYARSGVSVAGNKADSQFFSFRPGRRFRPEVFVDAICDVTGVPEKYADESVGTRAVELFAGNIAARSLDILGRCVRDSGCEQPDTARPGNLPRALHLINGPLINAKVDATRGQLAALMKQSEASIVQDLYVRALTRFPTANEKTFWVAQLKNSNDETEKREIAEDFLWSLLTCREFATIR